MPRFDFGRRSDDYARHRTGPPRSFYDRLETFVDLNGAQAVDLGTGPGLVAFDLAERGARVTGVDISSNQIDAARRTAIARGLEAACVFVVAPAEETGLPAGVCDLVTAGQCWGWFDNDLAAAEVLRLLRPGGWLAVVQFCYLPRHCPIARATETLILRHNPGWEMADFDGLYPQRIDQLGLCGLEFVEQFCFDHPEPFTHEAWRGRVRSCSGVGAGKMTDEEVARFDAELAELLARDFPDEPMIMPHRVWAVIARKRIV